MFLLACAAAPGGASAATSSYGFTGGSQTYVVPAGTGTLRIEAYGAQGGWYGDAAWGGAGAYVRSNVAVTTGETLVVRVGGQGGGSAATTAENSGGAGGYNGGGHGGSSASGNGSPGGGGASDVRRATGALADRVVVAGGGGGGAIHVGWCNAWTYSGHGGAGGAPSGGAGEAASRLSGGQDAGTGGGGATQTSGGAAASSYWSTSWPALAGSLGQGGRGSSATISGYNPGQGAGGGGGYYGGGGGGNSYECGHPGGGGGGGSSYASGTAPTMTAGARTGHGLVNITPIQPAAPSALAQWRADGTPVPTGAWQPDGATTNVRLRFSSSFPDASATLTPWVEVRPAAVAFTTPCGVAQAGTTFSGSAVAAPTAGVAVVLEVPVSGLVRGTRYRWRACAVAQDGTYSAWVAHGGTPDFGVDTPPPAPALVSPADPVPRMEVSSDGVTIMSVRVPETGWTDYMVPVSVAAGARNLSVLFANDFYNIPEDRNLYVDSLTFGPAGDAHEAETFTGCSGPYADGSASGGSALGCYSSNGATKAVTLSADATSLTVRARGSSALTITTTTPTLTATFSDPDAGDSGSITFELCADAACTTVLQSGSSASGLSSGTNGSWTVTTPLTPGSRYHWRARATDASGMTGPWSETRWFNVDRAPATPTLESPADTATTADSTPTLIARFSDPDGNVGLIRFQLCANATCTATGDPIQTGTSAIDQPDGSLLSWTSAMLPQGTYHWRAQNEDRLGMVSGWSAAWTLTIGSPSLSVGLSSPGIDLGTMNLGATVDATMQVTVGTNNATGYTLSARDDHDSAGMTHTNPAFTIADWTGLPTAPTPWAPGVTGHAGLTVLAATGGKDAARWGTGAVAGDHANLNYVGLQSTLAGTLHSRTTFSSASDTVEVAYRVGVLDTQVAGAYSGGITFSATTNP